MVALKIVTPPDGYPVSLAEAKAHLRVDFSDDDDRINLYLASAVQYAEGGDEGFLGRALLDQTWDFYLDAFPTDRRAADQVIRVPLPPLIEVIGVFYTDSAGDEQEWSAASYIVDAATQPARICIASGASWPTPKKVANAVRIRFRAGYLDTSSPPVANVPGDIRAAILLRMQADYDAGPDADRLRAAADTLLRRKRKHLGMA